MDERTSGRADERSNTKGDTDIHLNEQTRGKEFAVFPPGDGGRGISADATFDDGVFVDDAVLLGRSVVKRNILC